MPVRSLGAGMGFLLLLMISSPSAATESEKHQATCRSADARDRALCGFYVSGFLDGALLTDSAIVANLSEGGRSSFFERAYRTRTGMNPAPATALADFCLPEGLSTNGAAVLVVDRLSAGNPAGRSLQDQVYAEVKHLFPCEKPEAGIDE